jgi:hypothetical protein
MEIRVQRNAAFTKQPCLACGLWERPDDPAFFTDDHEWVCDRCVEGGEEFIREGFGERAEVYHRMAESYEQAATEEIALLDESEVWALRYEAKHNLADAPPDWRVVEEDAWRLS